MKRLIILVGLEGSGKTYIGTLIEEYLGIRLLRVEAEEIVSGLQGFKCESWAYDHLFVI